MRKTKRVAIVAVVVILLFSFGVSAQSVVPGDASDPLITLGYLNAKIDEVKQYVDEQINSSIQPGNETPAIIASSGAVVIEESIFEVLQLEEGQQLIGKESTSIILRTGEAKVVTLGVDGIADITDGIDVKNNEAIIANHLLLVPRDDGRGIEATTTVWIMVKGKYEIK